MQNTRFTCHAETFHPSAQHTRMDGWNFFLICLAALQRDGQYSLEKLQTTLSMQLLYRLMQATSLVWTHLLIRECCLSFVADSGFVCWWWW